MIFAVVWTTITGICTAVFAVFAVLSWWYYASSSGWSGFSESDHRALRHDAIESTLDMLAVACFLVAGIISFDPRVDVMPDNGTEVLLNYFLVLGIVVKMFRGMWRAGRSIMRRRNNGAS